MYLRLSNPFMVPPPNNMIGEETIDMTAGRKLLAQKKEGGQWYRAEWVTEIELNVVNQATAQAEFATYILLE